MGRYPPLFLVSLRNAFGSVAGRTYDVWNVGFFGDIFFLFLVVRYGTMLVPFLHPAQRDAVPPCVHANAESNGQYFC